MQAAAPEALDLARETRETLDLYGLDDPTCGHFAKQCLIARRLVERGVRFIDVSLHGWDTHSNNFTATPDLCEKLDRGLASLVADLHARGMLKDTLVVWAGEFGRTPMIQNSGLEKLGCGRDHNVPGFTALLALDA